VTFVHTRPGYSLTGLTTEQVVFIPARLRSNGSRIDRNGCRGAWRLCETVPVRNIYFTRKRVSYPHDVARLARCQIRFGCRKRNTKGTWLKGRQTGYRAAIG
jgi:hypothetical protein